MSRLQFPFTRTDLDRLKELAQDQFVEVTCSQPLGSGDDWYVHFTKSKKFDTVSIYLHLRTWPKGLSSLSMDVTFGFTAHRVIGLRLKHLVGPTMTWKPDHFGCGRRNVYTIGQLENLFHREKTDALTFVWEARNINQSVSTDWMIAKMYETLHPEQSSSPLCSTMAEGYNKLIDQLDEANTRLAEREDLADRYATLTSEHNDLKRKYVELTGGSSGSSSASASSSGSSVKRPKYQLVRDSLTAFQTEDAGEIPIQEAKALKTLLEQKTKCVETAIDDHSKCKICHTAEASHAVACGHRFCHPCISKFNKLCANCRKPFDTAIRLY